MPESQPKFQPGPAGASAEQKLGQLFTEALLQGDGVNDLLHRLLQGIEQALAVSQLVLYDYDELADTFDLLYFLGYPADARSELHRRLHALDVRRALAEREPYRLDGAGRQMLLPLYFQETLEAVLLLESADQPIVADEASRPAFKLISRFLGLFMSSSRLPVNQRKNVLSLTDLERAREVQMCYLPAEHPVTDRYEIYGYNQSAALVGGDYFDYFCERPSSIQCVVADACGHGLAAALIMSTFRGLLHSEVRQSDDLSTLFTRLNQRLYTGGGLLKYLTGVFFDYREDEGVLRYFNAGHFEPLLVRAAGASEWLPGGGPPLGMFQDSSYEINTCRIRPGDLLVLFTDGLVELRNAAEEYFGVIGACNAVLAQRHLPLRELAREVLSCAATFSHTPQPEDDLTLFLMRFR